MVTSAEISALVSTAETAVETASAATEAAAATAAESTVMAATSFYSRSGANFTAVRGGLGKGREGEESS